MENANNDNGVAIGQTGYFSVNAIHRKIEEYK